MRGYLMQSLHCDFMAKTIWLERFTTEITDDEILADIITNSICCPITRRRSGARHKRVPKDIEKPIIMGHGFAATS